MRHYLASRTSRFRSIAAVLGTAGVLLTGCDQFSPTAVENPNLTDEDFLETTDAARTWLRGVERQFMQGLNTLIVNSEITSDNYYNNYTTNNKVFDIPRIDSHDTDVRSMQLAVARLRETADFGLERALAADPTSTPREEAEFLFYRAMSSILTAEYFVGLPAGALEPVATPAEHLTAAIADLERARSLVSEADLVNGYTLAIARAHYRLGNPAAAASAAQALLAADPAYLRLAEYDGVSGPGNSMQGLLTSSVNNLQPLPRLDFLDPKYPNRGPQIQSAIAFLKAEEAHLILAEERLASGDLDGAKSRLLQLLDLVDARPVEMVDSRLQERGRAGGQVIYPDHSDYRVAFEPGAPLLDGFVLYRAGEMVPVPTISGTSVTRDRIGALQSLEDALYVLYLMRQEIFLAEGRRTTDLGIRFPVSFAEVQINPNVEDGQPFTQAILPAFIPGDYGLDSFDLDEDARTAVIHHDMNRYLVENRSAPEVLPFH